MLELEKKRAPQNRTITLSPEENDKLSKRLISLSSQATIEEVCNKTICQDALDVLDHLPDNSIDLLFADPPYNLSKTFNEHRFQSTSIEKYEAWLDTWVSRTPRLLKRTGSVYICGDWRSSSAIQKIGAKYFKVQNRITWEREKGRGAMNNWKNCSEDIWFFTVSDDYIFNVNAVMLKRQVMAPYTDHQGIPKDWHESQDGKFRLTYPSNIWTDLTVPFWSMPENTDHPTQKPEKLLAKIILASSREGDIILDPFLGSGTTSVVAKKLGRKYIGVEIDPYYCCLAEKRLEMVESDNSIQGYSGGVFWERNTLAFQNKNGSQKNKESKVIQPTLIQ
ncbi:MAG TPA: site-specific DNA-methyltransferase [Blastocatellia bacterium]|nr:site-specific DNA-methyltransferase [Blastocatellia bacterium]